MALAPAALAGAAAHGATGVGGGPSAAPSSPSLYRHSGTKIGVQWTNGDVTASTRVYYKQTENPTGCPSVFPDDVEPLLGTASPGGTTFDTNDEDSIEQCSYYVVHIKNGQFSTFVQVEDKLDSGTCIGCA